VIKYQLQCDADHPFEGWFQSGDAFDTQKKRGLVECPVCGSSKVDRAIMAPAVARTDRVEPITSLAARDPDWINVEQGMEIMSSEERELRERLAELRQELIKDADDVGTDFAEEARRMHYGEKESRQIYGKTSLEEARELVEDGISILPLPPGRDHN
jgi:hypothetical protein